MRIENEIKLDFCDVIIKPKRSDTPSRSRVDLIREYEFLNSKQKWAGIPIIASNMTCTGTKAMAEVLSSHKMMTCLHKYYSTQALVEIFSSDLANWTFYTLGIKDDEYEQLVALSKLVPNIPFICVDVANGYTKYFCDRVKKIRDRFPDSTIMAGNVCTPEMCSELLLSGAADIIKVGIGGGSACTTRLVAGVGYPQLSAIAETADAAHGLRGHIVGDGNCTNSGDVAKAFGAGADFVMLGGMFAGCLECEGEWEEGAELSPNKDGGTTVAGTPDGKIKWVKKSLRFYGMSSKEAMDKFNGGMADYRAAEGKSVSVPYKGHVKDTLQQITGGLRSACTYVGTEKLKDLSKCTTFVRVNRTHNTIFS